MRKMSPKVNTFNCERGKQTRLCCIADKGEISLRYKQMEM